MFCSRGMGLQQVSAIVLEQRNVQTFRYRRRIWDGIGPAQSLSADSEIRPMFEANGNDAFDLCRKLPIDYLVVRNGNPVWRDRISWVWRDTPVF